MITDEKRAFRRSPCRLKIEYRRQGAPAGGGRVFSENISLGGVYFISLERFEIGEVLDCRVFFRDSSDQGRWFARVVRCEKLRDKMIDTFGVAVELVRSFDGAEKKLKKLLKIR